MITQRGIDFIKQFEGYRDKAYLCSAGIPTIGYGHIRGVKIGDICTEEQAENWLIKDLQTAIRAVDRLIKVELNDNQKTAIISFTFNLGSGALQRSTLRTKLNRGEFEEIPKELLKWCKAGGRIINGLLRRRIAEGKLFNE